MVLTILGCGTSTGVPLIHCKCKVCRSKNPRNKRLRASAWLQISSKKGKPGKSILIDTATDLRQQALRGKIPRVDAVLYTHPHADHINGIDELRSFCFVQKSKIPVYGNLWTCQELQNKFKYCFDSKPAEGGGAPLLELFQFDANQPFLDVLGERFIPLALAHGSKESVGFRLHSLAYVTDCNEIPLSTLERMQDLSVLILDCIKFEPHQTHFNLEQALEIVARLKPKKTYLTHLGHDFDYADASKILPKGVAFAYDGLSINAI